MQDGRAIGAEDGHYVCRLCGLVMEPWYSTLPRGLEAADYHYARSLPWISGLNSALGAKPLHPIHVRLLIKRQYLRDPVIFWREWTQPGDTL